MSSPVSRVMKPKPLLPNHFTYPRSLTAVCSACTAVPVSTFNCLSRKRFTQRFTQKDSTSVRGIGAGGKSICCGYGLDYSDVRSVQARHSHHLHELLPLYICIDEPFGPRHRYTSAVVLLFYK